MPENADKHEQAFQHLVRLLEEAATAGATAVRLKREELGLMVIHCFKNMGRAEAPIPPDMEETVIEEIVKRAGLAHKSKGIMSVVLLGKEYDVAVDRIDDWGESEFTLTLKKGKQTAMRLSPHGANAVFPMQPSSEFKVGDLVRVKHGVADVDYPDIPMGGWVGRISKTGSDSYLIRWDVETLENIHPVYRKRCERDGIDLEEYWVNVADLEPAPLEPLNMEQPTAIITRPLSVDSQLDRICMVFGLTSDDPLPCDSKATELMYFNYLKANLTFPFPAQFLDPFKNRKREVMVVGMSDDFPIDEGFGVVCEVLDGGEQRQLPLSELKVEPGHPNHEMVDDYITWFVNSPEAGVDDSLGGDWNDTNKIWEDTENNTDDGDEDRMVKEAPPPARQRTGRNDPCPCGSGKKFKKCCLNKSRQSGLFD